MNENDRNRFESIFQLYSHSWQQFNVRRTYEWKISISLWTALGLAIVGVVNAESIPEISGGMYILFSILLFVIMLQLIFIKGIARNHGYDRKIALHYQKFLHEISQTKFEEPLERVLEKGRRNWGVFLNWSSILQIGVTIVLSILFLVIIQSKMGN
jgi:hypothetical protein